MNHGCVMLDEVFAAAGIRAASIVPETSGYLALAIGDATSRLPFAVEDRVVMLTTEGNVGITRRGEVLPPQQAAANMRSTLARLLAVSTGTAMPSLTAAARPREESDRGVDAVIEEIEAALIPVNRAAARRALARLARETIKAKEAGRLRRASARPAPRPAPAAAPAAPPAPPPPAAAAPPPPPPAPVVAAPAPVVVAPAAPEPPPAPASSPDLEAVAAAAALTPPPETHEPTPTELGMAPIEEIDVDISPAPRPAAPHAPSELAMPTPTGLPEAAVLTQPTEDRRLAFALERRADGGQAITPLYAFEIAEPRLPSAQPPSAPAEPAPPPLARRAPPAPKNTRADELLAHFGASCVDAESMRNAAACLRRMTGVDPTPPPPARVEIRLPESRPAQPQGLVTLPPDWWTSDETQRLPRRRSLWSRLVVPLVTLMVGLAGGVTFAWLHAERTDADTHPATAPTAPSVEKSAEKKEPAPPPATEPAGAVAPQRLERMGGARAERGSEQRAR